MDSTISAQKTVPSIKKLKTACSLSIDGITTNQLSLALDSSLLLHLSLLLTLCLQFGNFPSCLQHWQNYFHSEKSSSQSLSSFELLPYYGFCDCMDPGWVCWSRDGWLPFWFCTSQSYKCCHCLIPLFHYDPESRENLPLRGIFMET